MPNSKEELEQLLKNVKGTYIDFIEATLDTAEEFNAYKRITEFIKLNPNATSSDICRFVDDTFYFPKK